MVTETKVIFAGQELVANIIAGDNIRRTVSITWDPNRTRLVNATSRLSARVSGTLPANLEFFLNAQKVAGFRWVTTFDPNPRDATVNTTLLLINGVNIFEARFAAVGAGVTIDWFLDLTYESTTPGQPPEPPRVEPEPPEKPIDLTPLLNIMLLLVILMMVINIIGEFGFARIARIPRRILRRREEEE
jgi:hypothetical protein